MNICIFCSAYVTDEKYAKPAIDIATLLGQGGHNLVWGGSNVGLMKTVADAFKANGGRIYGVSLEAYRYKMHADADEMMIAKNLGERKAAMLQKADTIIALPGGIGTLDEITDVLELKKQDFHHKPIIILNSDGFYEGLRMQLSKMESEGFLPKPLAELIAFIDTPEAIRKHIKFG